MVDKLTGAVAIVDRQGKPTTEYMIKWQQLSEQLGTLPALSTPAEVSAVLDVIDATVGSILIRGSSEWEGLAAGTTGEVLTIAAGAPAWQAPAGGSFIGGTPPTIVQSGTDVSTSGGYAVTLGAAPASGDLLIAIVSTSGANPSATSGWAQLVLGGSSPVDVAIFTKTAGAGESATQTPCTGSGSVTVAMWDLSGTAGGIVAYAAAAVSSTSLFGAAPTFPVLSSTLCLAAVTTTSASLTGYGLPTSTTLNTTGLHTVAASGTSNNAQSFGLSGIFASGVAWGYASIVIQG